MTKKDKWKKGRREKTKGEALYDLFSSVKTTVVLCLLMAVISLAGTLIKQNASPQEYFHLYGSVLTGLFQKLGLFDLYHSKGFTILLLLLAANLVCCSIRNLPRVWKLSFGPRTMPTHKALKARENNSNLSCPLDPSETENRVARVLEETFGTPKRFTGDEGNALYCRKGAFSRFGPYLTHLGILLILAGAVVGSLFGFKGFVNIPEGEKVSSIRLMGSGDEYPLDFSVTCKQFIVEFYENGMPKEYRSELLVQEGEEEISVDSLRVNHPFKHKGIYFYQSSYGQAGNSQVVFDIQESDKEEKTQVTAHMGMDTEVPGTGDRIRLVDYSQDFIMPGAQPGMSVKGLGPAVQVIVFRGEKHTRPYWVLRDYPAFQKSQDLPYTILLKQVNAKYYTGLQVAKDPGTPIVWAGCILMIFGLIVAFYFSQREIWVRVSPAKKGSTVVMAGWANKNKERFERAFQGVSAAIHKELSATP